MRVAALEHDFELEDDDWVDEGTEEVSFVEVGSFSSVLECFLSSSDFWLSFLSSLPPPPLPPPPQSPTFMRPNFQQEGGLGGLGGLGISGIPGNPPDPIVGIGL